MVELIEIEPGRWRIKRDLPPPARSSLPMPMIISDIMEPTEQVDGKFYTSKREFRAVGRGLGLTEVGNERPKPKQRATADASVKRARRDVIGTAIAQYGAGRRSRPL
jgi:hypothetical protein